MIAKEVIAKFDEACSRGLCSGVGSRNGQMCIEAAICYALGLPHGDEPECVTPAVRAFKIRLNDALWSSPAARAAGLRDLGLAQIGSKGVVDGVEFSRRLTEKTIGILIPALFRAIFADNPDCLASADLCEKEPTAASAARAASAASAAAWAAQSAESAESAQSAAQSAASAARAASAASAESAQSAAQSAASAARADKYLIMSAQLALEVLRELKSPGCEWLVEEVKHE